MPDLGKKFFQEDLTEAEEKDLAEALWDSEQTAQAFGAMAEEAYKSCRLPEPEWVDPPDALPKGRGGWKGRAGLFLLCVLLAGALLGGWKYKQSLGRWAAPLLGNKSETLEGPVALKVKSVPDTVAQDLAGKGPDAPVREKGDPIASLAKVSPGAGSNPETSVPLTSSPPKAALPFMTPVKLEDSPSRTFSEIAVNIHQAEDGSVTLRVLDMTGREVLPLYSGALGPGDWVFEWDGKLADGRKADPGHYQVEVRSGRFQRRQKIRVR